MDRFFTPTSMVRTVDRSIRYEVRVTVRIGRSPPQEVMRVIISGQVAWTPAVRSQIRKTLALPHRHR
jgi:hypothetical protein